MHKCWLLSSFTAPVIVCSPILACIAASQPILCVAISAQVTARALDTALPPHAQPSETFGLACISAKSLSGSDGMQTATLRDLDGRAAGEVCSLCRAAHSFGMVHQQGRAAICICLGQLSFRIRNGSRATAPDSGGDMPSDGVRAQLREANNSICKFSCSYWSSSNECRLLRTVLLLD